MPDDPKTPDRYLQLNGEPVHVPTWRGRWMTPQGKTAALTTVFSAVAAAAVDGPTAAAVTAGAGGLGFMLAARFRGFLSGRFMSVIFGDAAESSCIDKMPDQHTPPTDEDNYAAARHARQAYQSGLWTSVPLFLFAGAVMMKDIVSAASGAPHTAATMPGATMVLNFIMANAIHDLYQYRNFSKVVDREWIIANTPVKDEETEKLPLPAPTPA